MYAESSINIAFNCFNMSSRFSQLFFSHRALITIALDIIRRDLYSLEMCRNSQQQYQNKNKTREMFNNNNNNRKFKFDNDDCSFNVE